MKLNLHNTTKIYEKQHALNHIDLQLDGIASLVLVGPSGSGKTTLLRVLAGLEVPESGMIEINGRRLNFDDTKALLEHRKRIGVVFQAYNLFPHLTALENIVLPLVKVHRLAENEAAKRAQQLLLRFALKEHQHKKPIQLSGGQQQRIALCRAAALRPELLFLDEPTSALDPELTVEVLDLIHELKQEGIEFILVTHEMGFAASVADHVCFMDEGGVLEHGLPEKIFHHEHSHPRVRSFMDKILKYESNH